MKRRGVLHVVSVGESFALRFYPERAEQLEREIYVDRDVAGREELGSLLMEMGFNGVADFLDRLRAPDAILELLPIQFSKEELRKFGLLGPDPSGVDLPSAPDSEDALETGE